MKFARYLQETQTPEWKKAYIDYNGLKKLINAIRKSQDPEGISSSPDLPDLRLSESKHVSTLASAHVGSGAPSPLDKEMLDEFDIAMVPTLISLPFKSEPTDTQREAPTTHESGCGCCLCKPSIRQTVVSGFRKSWHARCRSMTATDPLAAPDDKPSSPLPLHKLLPRLSSIESSFFVTLDMELDKIEGFYLDREKEMQSRHVMLETQLKELGDHGRLVEAASSKATGTTSVVGFSTLCLNLKYRPCTPKLQSADDGDDEKQVPIDEIRVNLSPLPELDSESRSKRRGNSVPVNYLYARKKLKKAMFEHYRGLEVLNNYRILNIMGFRKALKKFEKVTKIQAQEAYMQEKVERSAFFSDRAVSIMMAAMEELFSSSFERGDRKKALHYLRAMSQQKSYYSNMFSSGIFIGLAAAAFSSGLYESFQPDTRAAIPEWDSLLLVYAIFLVPTLFALLVGINLLVYSQARINYVFIFELDTRTRLDHREFILIPAIILTALCQAFWFSFLRVGAPSVSPTAWPLIWLGFTFFVMFNPFDMMSKPARWWLIKNVARLLVSGMRRVEFTDFWMGDQFCSLIFTLSNLPFVVCAYVGHFDHSLTRCTSSSRLWPLQFVLSALPLFVRLVQSVKRYADSKMLTHLINGGKYGVGIICYLFYFRWRHQGSSIQGASFALYCIFASASSLYGLAWDFLVDWSFFQRRAKYPMLRSELVYTSYVPMYYVAIVSNALIRFGWIFYIPQGGLNSTTMSFIMAMLEMLRRWQWNFYRLENEHLGNVDQYRATREIPLPYSFDCEDKVMLRSSSASQLNMGTYRPKPRSFLSFS